MTEAKAIEFQREIEKVCNQYQVWAEIKQDKRYDRYPALKGIEIKVSLKVDGDN